MANVAILLQEFFPADTRVRKEVHALCEDGHEIDIFCLKGENEEEFEILDGVNIFRTSISKKRGSFLRYVFEYCIFFIRARRWVINISKKKRIDIVHVHTLPDFLVFAATPLKRKGAKIILDLHEITPEFFMSKYNIDKNHLLISLLKWIERKSIMSADKVITVNHSMQKLFAQRANPKNEISVIMNTVDEKEFPIFPKKRSDKITAVYHGTLTKLYNLDFAIRAIKKIESKVENFEFHIYGTGSEVENIRSLIRDLKIDKIVFLHGWIDYKMIPEILSSVDIAILPIHKNVMTDLSFSNKIAEYVHCGIPVLSSDLASVQQYFNFDCVQYYEDGNEYDFCEKLLDMILYYDKSVARARQASKVYEEISWIIMKDRYKKIIKDIANMK